MTEKIYCCFNIEGVLEVYIPKIFVFDSRSCEKSKQDFQWGALACKMHALAPLSSFFWIHTWSTRSLKGHILNVEACFQLNEKSHDNMITILSKCVFVCARDSNKPKNIDKALFVCCKNEWYGSDEGCYLTQITPIFQFWNKCGARHGVLDNLDKWLVWRIKVHLMWKKMSIQSRLLNFFVTTLFFYLLLQQNRAWGFKMQWRKSSSYISPLRLLRKILFLLTRKLLFEFKNILLAYLIPHLNILLYPLSYIRHTQTVSCLNLRRISRMSLQIIWKVPQTKKRLTLSYLSKSRLFGWSVANDTIKIYKYPAHEREIFFSLITPWHILSWNLTK